MCVCVCVCVCVRVCVCVFLHIGTGIYLCGYIKCIGGRMYFVREKPECESRR